MTLQKKLFYIAGAIWTAVALVFFTIGLEPGEARMGSLLLMMYWGFPSAMVIPWFLTPIAERFDIVLFSTSGGTLGHIFSWLMMFVFGFVQWFVVVPFVCRVFNRLAKWSARFP